MLRTSISQESASKLGVPPDQRVVDQERLQREGSSTKSQGWKPVDEEREKVRITSELYSVTGNLPIGTSMLLKGLKSTEAHQFRVRVVNDVLNAIAEGSKTSNEISRGSAAPSTVELIDKSLAPFALLEVLESLEGVSTPESIELRRFIVNSAIGEYFGQSSFRHRFIGLFVASFSGTAGKADSILEDFTNRVAAMESGNQIETLKLYEESLTKALKGSTSNFAQRVRKDLGIREESVIERVIGTDNEAAWKKRRAIVEKLEKETKARGASEEHVWYIDLEDFWLDFANCDSKESWEFREELFKDPHVDRNDLLLSVGKLDSEPAKAFADKLIKEIFEDDYYINKAKAEGNEPIAESQFFRIKTKSPLYSLMGKDTELAWKVRKELVEKHKIPLRYVLATTVSDMTSESAEKFVEEMTKDMTPTERREIILASMPGSELKTVWMQREEIIQELRNEDRLKIRTYGDKISRVSQAQQDALANRILPVLIAGGHLSRDAQSKSVINFLQRLSDDRLMEIGSEDSANGFSVFGFVDDIQRAYFGVSGERDYRLLISSLMGCTSERGRRTRILLAKQGVPKEAILATIRGVFTKEAQTLRDDYLRTTFNRINDRSQDDRFDIGHASQVLITNLLVDGPVLEDRFDP